MSTATPTPLANYDDVLFVVDHETGEITVGGLANAFQVDSEDAANWVLGKMLAVDCQIAAVNASEIVQQARAILANAEGITKDLQRKRDALEYRFGNELAEYARSALAGEKGRTWKALNGSVSFRATPARIAVDDEDKALAWAAFNCTAAIKVTSKFLVSMVPDGVVPDGCTVVPAGESAKIKTGVAA